MVGAAPFTVRVVVLVTESKSPAAAWVAVIVEVPTARIFKIPPLTVATLKFEEV
jgi:hypothetical protein